MKKVLFILVILVFSINKVFTQIDLTDTLSLFSVTNDLKTEWRDGVVWCFYTNDKLRISTTNFEIKDYGKWYQIPIIIENNSDTTIEFNPSEITSYILNRKKEIVELEVWSADDYMKKVKNSQDLTAVLFAVAEGLNAGSAGYSTSTSMYSGYTQNGYTYGTVRTTTYSPTKSYQAQQTAINNTMNVVNYYNEERVVKEQGYLKRTTIYPNETISGYVNIKRKKGEKMCVIIDIEGTKYIFPWNIKKQ